MKKTKYIKVAVADRLPIQKYSSVFTNEGLAYINEESNWRDENVNDVYPEYWLEEVPDHESELVEMLEEIVTQFDWKNENDSNQQLSIDKAKQLLQKIKEKQ